MSEWRIITPDGAQTAVYAAIIRHSFATVAADFGLTRETCPTHASFLSDEALAEKCREAGFHPFGYTADGVPVGFAALADRGGGVWELRHLAVLPAHRHRGYGRALLAHCKAQVRALGGRRITIGIIEAHEVLRAWYAANGFVHTGTRTFPHLPFVVGFMAWEAEDLCENA